jgi:hypothetical protein
MVIDSSALQPEMSGKFERERYFVEELAASLEWPTEVAYRDPVAEYGYETGADVIALMPGRRIGIQVTEYDGGEGVPTTGGGWMRAQERRQIREAGRMGVYTGWGSPYFNEAFRARVAAKVAKSERYSFTDFDGVYLLVVANVPGAGISTFVPYRHIDPGLLDELAGVTLGGSNFETAFLHIIMGSVLFRWDRPSGWRSIAIRRQG